MTGFGRTGTLFACEQAGIAPDLMCLSKGITGGYLPLSCVLSTDDVYESFYDDRVARGFLHSHSYSGNALACRAALAVLDLFERENVIAANEARAARFVQAAAILAHDPRVRDFRHLGMIWAFEVPSAEPAFAQRAFEIALEQGVLLRPIGNTVYFMPPYVVDDEDFGRLVNAGSAIVERLGLRCGARSSSPSCCPRWPWHRRFRARCARRCARRTCRRMPCRSSCRASKRRVRCSPTAQPSP
jgi:adenosylmethionine-8-amino-7-oxononanoate aminotransferase